MRSLNSAVCGLYSCTKQEECHVHIRCMFLLFSCTILPVSCLFFLFVCLIILTFDSMDGRLSSVCVRFLAIVVF